MASFIPAARDRGETNNPIPDAIDAPFSAIPAPNRRDEALSPWLAQVLLYGKQAETAAESGRRLVGRVVENDRNYSNRDEGVST